MITAADYWFLRLMLHMTPFSISFMPQYAYGCAICWCCLRFRLSPTLMPHIDAFALLLLSLPRADIDAMVFFFATYALLAPRCRRMPRCHIHIYECCRYAVWSLLLICHWWYFRCRQRHADDGAFSLCFLMPPLSLRCWFSDMRHWLFWFTMPSFRHASSMPFHFDFAISFSIFHYFLCWLFHADFHADYFDAAFAFAFFHFFFADAACRWCYYWLLLIIWLLLFACHFIADADIDAFLFAAVIDWCHEYHEYTVNIMPNNYDINFIFTPLLFSMLRFTLYYAALCILRCHFRLFSHYAPLIYDFDYFYYDIIFIIDAADGFLSLIYFSLSFFMLLYFHELSFAISLAFLLLFFFLSPRHYFRCQRFDFIFISPFSLFRFSFVIFAIDFAAMRERAARCYRRDSQIISCWCARHYWFFATPCLMLTLP